MCTNLDFNTGSFFSVKLTETEEMMNFALITFGSSLETERNDSEYHSFFSKLRENS